MRFIRHKTPEVGGVSYIVNCPDCSWTSLPLGRRDEANESARRHWEFNHGPNLHRCIESTFTPQPTTEEKEP